MTFDNEPLSAGVTQLHPRLVTPAEIDSLSITTMSYVLAIISKAERKILYEKICNKYPGSFVYTI